MDRIGGDERRAAEPQRGGAIGSAFHGQTVLVAVDPRAVEKESVGTPRGVPKNVDRGHTHRRLGHDGARCGRPLPGDPRMEGANVG